MTATYEKPVVLELLFEPLLEPMCGHGCVAAAGDFFIAVCPTAAVRLADTATALTCCTLAL